MFKQNDFIVSKLGNCKIKSPLNLSKEIGDGVFNYIDDEERVLYHNDLKNFKECCDKNIEPITFEKSGPREFIYFDPPKTTAAIVTCGGLCPGLNNVIRGLVIQLHNRYGVRRIVGIKYGYEGFIPEYKHDILELTPSLVEDIHQHGGTILGSSRGPQDVGKIVDALERLNINILFTIGGDGTLRGALEISEEIERRGLKIVVAGIPKTIDNDINLIEKSFGFETSFTVAREILTGAHNEAKGAYNGITLVKLMGRESGFISAYAALAVQEVNFVLIPEMDFELYGDKGFFNALKKRLEIKHHALIVVAEGAGQNLFTKDEVIKDISGNIKFKDIGVFLKEKISKEFKSQKFPFTLRYIDPSYIIRSAPANANDSIFCNILAQNAAHGALTGRTGFVVGYWNSEFTYMPISMAIQKRNKINIEGEFWSNLLETTGQPNKFVNE